jgi:O-antigen ligase
LDGERAQEISRQLGVSGLVQAHNGYIELYLNLGVIGVTLLLLGVFSGFRNALRDESIDYRYVALRVVLIVTVLVYNYTEATFAPVNNMFVLSSSPSCP